jgi:hypothetical protein
MFAGLMDASMNGRMHALIIMSFKNVILSRKIFKIVVN